MRRAALSGAFVWMIMLSGCSAGTGGDGSALIEDDFSTPRGWRVSDDALASDGYTDGRYRILVRATKHEETVAAFQDEKSKSLRVEVEASKGAAGGPQGLIGVGCVSVTHESGYDFVVDPDSGNYGILKSAGAVTTLADGVDTTGTVRRGAAANIIRGECDSGGPNTPATLALFVNGAKIAQVSDPQGVGPFDGMELVAVTVGTAGVEGLFDNAVAMGDRKPLDLVRRIREAWGLILIGLVIAGAILGRVVRIGSWISSRPQRRKQREHEAQQRLIGEEHIRRREQNGYSVAEYRQWLESSGEDPEVIVAWLEAEKRRSAASRLADH